MTHSDDPAYPIANDKLRDAVIGPYGLSKREYFAAQVDVSWNAVMELLQYEGFPKPTFDEKLRARARIRVMEADALIAELNKPK